MRSLALALSLAVLSACSSSQNATGPTTYTKTANGAQVEVLLDEYKIHMPTTIPPGEITFNVKNTGHHEHTIEVSGQAVDAKLSPNLKPGDSATLRVHLDPGTYKVWCPVGPHANMGMRLQLTVSEK